MRGTLRHSDTIMGIVADICRQALVPPATITMADWLRENFYTPDGRAFDEFSVPWVTAPQGPCWAYDNPQFNLFWLQWAARMFKTNFGLATLMRRMDRDPCDMMFATPDETNCKQVFGRWWKMIEHCPAIRDESPIPRYQAKTHIKLKRSQCYGAWPRGKSRLADKSIPTGHANEIDKWDHLSTATEGDPLPRFLKRGAEYPDRKFTLESTPGTKGRSRVEAGRLQSTNHRYYVPCPHCAKFQIIEWDRIQWEKTPDGTSDRQLARTTAHYVCVACESRIDDIHRTEMVNRGVWVPDGCEVDHERAMEARDLAPDDSSWLIGEPRIWGNSYGSQISVFYALFHGWGQIVDDFLGKKDRAGDIRQWINEDKAETWEPMKRAQTWEQLGERLIVDLPRRVVPANHSVVTIGIDKQEAYYVYSVDSWGNGMSSHTLDYGIADEIGTLLELAQAKWIREGDGKQVKATAVLIDSGYRPAEVHAFVLQCAEKGLPVRACRGSNTPLTGFYSNKQNGPKSSAPGQWVTWVDTHSTQDWLEKRLHVLQPGDIGGMSVFSGSLVEHQDWLEQLLNEGLISTLDARNQVKESWQRIDTMMPNDLRDCKRYAMVGMLLATRGGRAMRVPEKPQKSERQEKKKSIGKPPHLLQRPGGWLGRR